MNRICLIVMLLCGLLSTRAAQMSVKQFGAYGDGPDGHDDTASISNAMVACAPGELVFPAGTYKMRAVLVPSNLKLTSQGATIYVISIPNTSSNYATASGWAGAEAKVPKYSPGFCLTRATNVVISGFRFNMAPTSEFFGGPQSAISIQYSQNVEVRGCDFAYTNDWFAVSVSASKTVSVHDNDFHGNDFSTAQIPAHDDRYIGESIYDSSVTLGVEDLSLTRNRFSGTNSAVRARIFFSSVGSFTCSDNRLVDVQSPTSIIYAYIGDLGLHNFDGSWRSNATWRIERNICSGKNNRWGSPVCGFIKTKGISGAPVADHPDSLRESTAYGSVIADNVCDQGNGFAGLDIAVAGARYEGNRIKAKCRQLFFDTGNSTDTVIRSNRFEAVSSAVALTANSNCTNENTLIEGNTFIGGPADTALFIHPAHPWNNLTLRGNQWHDFSTNAPSGKSDAFWRLIVTNQFTVENERIYLHGKAYDNRPVIDLKGREGSQTKMSGVSIVPSNQKLSVFGGVFQADEGDFTDCDLGAAEMKFSKRENIFRSKIKKRQ